MDLNNILPFETLYTYLPSIAFLTAYHHGPSILFQATEIGPNKPIHLPPKPPVPSIFVFIPLSILGQHGPVSDPVLVLVNATAFRAVGEPRQDGYVAEDAIGEGWLGEQGLGDGAQDCFADGGDCGHLFF